jgi:hypothetical protein
MAAVLAVVLLALSVAVEHARAQAPVLVEQLATGSFVRAVRVAIAPQGWVYIVDGDANAVYLYRSLTENPTWIGGYGWTATTFDDPSGVATDGLNVYVSDRGNHRIQRFDRYLNYISSLSTRDTSVAPMRFGFPRGIALSPQGDVFVIDGENLRVVKFSVTGEFDRAFGQNEQAGGRLTNPVAIGISSWDHVYVLEPARLLEYDNFGNYVRTVEEGMVLDATGLAITPTGFLIVSPDRLVWLSQDGILLGSLLRTEIIASTPLATLQDAAISGSRLFLLTASQIVVFRIMEN